MRVVLGVWGWVGVSWRVAGEFARARERLAPLPGAMRVRYSGGCAGPAGHLGYPSGGVWASRTVVAAVHGRKCRGLGGGRVLMGGGTLPPGLG